jgi:hypothetical protein
MDDQRVGREGSGGVNRRTRLLTALFVLANAFAVLFLTLPAYREGLFCLALFVGAALVGSVVLMPFGLARWGAVLGVVLLLTFLVFVGGMIMGK